MRIVYHEENSASIPRNRKCPADGCGTLHADHAVVLGAAPGAAVVVTLCREHHTDEAVAAAMAPACVPLATPKPHGKPSKRTKRGG